MGRRDVSYRPQSGHSEKLFVGPSHYTNVKVPRGSDREILRPTRFEPLIVRLRQVSWKRHVERLSVFEPIIVRLRQVSWKRHVERLSL
jgi:hypothetical protein